MANYMEEGDISMNTKRRLGLNVQNWSIELEFSQPNFSYWDLLDSDQ